MEIQDAKNVYKIGQTMITVDRGSSKGRFIAIVFKELYVSKEHHLIIFT